MASYSLENEECKAVIDSHGAELRSLQRKSDEREMMWCGDAAYWGRVSPVLFPVVGAYRNQECRFEGRTYHLGQHGFARDQEFALISQSVNDISLELRMTKEEAQEKGYPFAFSLVIRYVLEGAGVRVCWKVRNIGGETMYFSVGGHPAFAVPARRADRTTCYLRFEGVDVLHARMLEGGLASDKVNEYVLAEDGILAVTEELFANDALVIENGQTGRVSLLDEEKREFLTVAFDAPLFGVWTPPEKNAPFICIEPWYGRCDRVDFEGTLEQREWGNTLEAGEEFEADYRIII